MTKIAIPNETVRLFTGRPMRAQALNDDLEPLFKPVRCPKAGCSEQTYTILRAIQEHLREEHADDRGDEQVSMVGEMVDVNTSRLILDILGAFNRADSRESPNTLRRVQKPNDSHHAGEVWRCAWNARSREEIKLKKEQYDWLQQLLDRKLPLDPDVRIAKEKKEGGEEPQTIASYLYGLSEDNIRQALTTLPDRRKADPEDAETEPVGAAA